MYDYYQKHFREMIWIPCYVHRHEQVQSERRRERKKRSNLNIWEEREKTFDRKALNEKNDESACDTAVYDYHDDIFIHVYK